MKLAGIIKSHDEALAAKSNILELVCDGNHRLGIDLIDIDETKECLSIIFKHIELLEEMAFGEERGVNGNQKNV